MHIEGLMTGALNPELSGSTYIRSSSGFTAKIDYTCKGWVRGKRNGFTATLFRDGQEGSPLYTVEGQWNDTWTCKNLKTNKEVEKFSINAIKRTPLQVAPIEQQHPLESRKAWRHVVDAIENNDIYAVGHEKSKIENQQREMRKEEKAEGTEYPRRYFSRAAEDVIADRLAGQLEGVKESMDGGEGVWMWDEEKYRRVSCTVGLSGLRSPRRERFDSGVGGMMMKENEYFPEAQKV